MRETRRIWTLIVPALLACLAGPAAAAPSIVEDGESRAEIVIAEDPPRMVKLAAEELQAYLEKISGARLPVVTGPGAESLVKIYVGRSAHTDRLGISDEGLDGGAFRIVSRASSLARGENWLALVGRDSDFTPKEPWGRQRPDRDRVFAEWDALTGGKWNNPVGVGMYNTYSRTLGIWQDDERGSLNAVYEFLRGLGVRWYMPGELGEIVPRAPTIALPREDRVVRPDFAIRDIMYFGRYGRSPEEGIRWHLRLGLNHGLKNAGPHFTHAIRDVLSRPEMRAAHPEYYALIGGKRAAELDGLRGQQACLSSEGLLQENVRFVRALFDLYDIPLVSVMPEDGFSFCQCELCAGKETVERGRLGAYSDYVWGYVNRVAQEVYKTHPDKLIRCGAYGAYTLPPEKIEKLSPNLVVGIVHGRGKNFTDPETRRQLLELRQAWLDKAPRALTTSEHYVFTHRGTYLPVYFLRSIAGGLRSLKGVSLGEDIETAPDPATGGLHVAGFNHLNVYVTSRFYWDAGQDLDALLDEYCTLFYGPAREEMRAFIEYSEENYEDMRTSAEKIDRALGLFDAAARKVPPESAYGRRLALLADYLEPLRSRRDQLARGRGDAPGVTVSAREDANILVDGKLDEEAWQGLAAHALKDFPTGGAPAAETTFRVFWEGDRVKGALFVGIRCEEPDTGNLKITPMKDPGMEIWNGDRVEILLETQGHSYYQLVVDPGGALVDLDRQGGKLGYDWSSRAETAAHVGENYWSVEVRLPVPGVDKPDDPLDGLAGRRPREDYPWYFNVCRQRFRASATEESSFTRGVSENGRPTWHDVMNFGNMHAR